MERLSLRLIPKVGQNGSNTVVGRQSPKPPLLLDLKLPFLTVKPSRCTPKQSSLHFCLEATYPPNKLFLAMAGVAFLFILEIASTFFEVAQLGLDLFPPKTPAVTTVRVLLGENANLAASLSGNVPGVALWNRFGQQIGHTQGSGEVEAQGSFIEIQVEHDEKMGNIPA